MVAERTAACRCAVAFKGPMASRLTLDAYAGKTVLLNLWATWCVPCREEMPALNALQKAARQRQLRGRRRSTSTPATTRSRRPSCSETGIDALRLLPRCDAWACFNALKKAGLAFGLPVTLLIDGKGCLLSAMNGPAAWDSEDAKALIKAATACS